MEASAAEAEEGQRLQAIVQEALSAMIDVTRESAMIDLAEMQVTLGNLLLFLVLMNFYFAGN